MSSSNFFSSFRGFAGNLQSEAARLRAETSGDVPARLDGSRQLDAKAAVKSLQESTAAVGGALVQLEEKTARHPQSIKQMARAMKTLHESNAAALETLEGQLCRYG